MEQLRHFIFDTGIGSHGDGRGPERTHLGQHLFCGLVVGMVVDADAITLLRRQQGGGGADATAGTSDDDDVLHESANCLEMNIRQ